MRSLNSIRSVFLLLACLSLLGGYHYLHSQGTPDVIEWQVPTSPPTGDNAPRPIHSGTEDQVKLGPLSVKTLLVSGNAQVFGTTTLGKILASEYCNQNGSNCKSRVGDTVRVKVGQVESIWQQGTNKAAKIPYIPGFRSSQCHTLVTPRATSNHSSYRGYDVTTIKGSNAVLVNCRSWEGAYPKNKWCSYMMVCVK